MTRAKGRREMADEVKTVTHELFNNHDGLHGRDPNVMYLDMEERIHGAETAKALGYDVDTSDLGKLPVTAGTPLVVKANLGDNLTSNPSTALLNARAESDRKVDPVTEAEFAVAPDDTASPFSATAPADDVASGTAPATTVGTGQDTSTTSSTVFDASSDHHDPLG